MKVIVLGASGMLGSMIVDYLSRDPFLKVAATVRDPELLQRFQAQLPAVEWHLLDAEQLHAQAIRTVLDDALWAINAVGVIKPYIHEDNVSEVRRALHVNACFPHRLARAAEQCGCHVLQIATDCVYSGRRGHYAEPDRHDAEDVYGKTKSLGEVDSPHVHHLRCSIIGPEPKGHVSLLDWFLGQPPHGRLNGYSNHTWNGVTTLHFARLCHAIVTQWLTLPHVQHVVPAGPLSKAQLLSCFATQYRREDLSITPTEAESVIDRTLETVNETLNRQLWRAAGYPEPPSVPQMVAELAAFDYRFGQGQ
jgi:dTDP-4-dehydrorhamnose reductase